MAEMTPEEVLQKQKDTLAQIRTGAVLTWLSDKRRRDVAESLAADIKKAEAKGVRVPRP